MAVRHRDLGDRRRLHRLVDELPDGEVHAAERYLEYLRDVPRDQLLRALANAPVDDEPLTEGDIAALAEADADVARGELVPWDEVRRDLLERS